MFCIAVRSAAMAAAETPSQGVQFMSWQQHRQT
jgi:hypothetical protein